MLRELRKKAGLTQLELANRLGMSISAISLYEKGERQPKLDMIPKLATALSVSVEAIVNCFKK